MRTIATLFAIQLCCLAVSGFNPIRPRPTVTKRKPTVPKYIMQIYEKNLKEGKSVNLHCVFPSKFTMTLMTVFNQASINFVACLSVIFIFLGSSMCQSVLRRGSSLIDPA